MIIAVCNSKGGVFKTGTTLNLAVYLEKYKPVVIDLDSQNSTTYLNNIRSLTTNSLNVVTIHNEKDLEDIINKSTSDNLYIIDTGGFDSSLTRAAIITADFLLSPTSGFTVDLLGLNKFESILKELSKIKKETITTNVFINNVKPSATKFDDMIDFIKSSGHFNLLKSIVRDRADFPNAINKGLSVKEFNPVGKAAIEFKTLTQEIESLLYKI